MKKILFVLLMTVVSLSKIVGVESFWVSAENCADKLRILLAIQDPEKYKDSDGNYLNVLKLARGANFGLRSPEEAIQRLQNNTDLLRLTIEATKKSLDHERKKRDMGLTNSNWQKDSDY